MALLKAFVCQVVLLGLYKLFLEQIFEDYLVPDELIRNCLVGFVCLLCFGIQLYTDKSADDDNDEAVEDLKATSNKTEASSTKKYESAETCVTHETVREIDGLNTTSQRMVTKMQTTSQGIAAGIKTPSNDEKVAMLAEQSNAISSIDGKNINLVSNSGIFAHFSNKPDTIPNIKAEASVSNSHVSYNHEMITIPVLNGLSGTNVCEESDDEGIVIDSFEIKESVKKVSEPLAETKVEEFIAEPVTNNITAESECLVSNGETVSYTQVLGETTTLETIESEPEMTNKTAENLNNIDIISNIIEETESKSSVKDETMVNQELILLSQSDERTKDTTEPQNSTQEVNSSNSASIEAVETINKKIAEKSLITKAAVPSTTQKMEATGDLCVAPITIDISFIYACY